MNSVTTYDLKKEAPRKHPWFEYPFNLALQKFWVLPGCFLFSAVAIVIAAVEVSTQEAPVGATSLGAS